MNENKIEILVLDYCKLMYALGNNEYRSVDAVKTDLTTRLWFYYVMSTIIKKDLYLSYYLWMYIFHLLILLITGTLWKVRTIVLFSIMPEGTVCNAHAFDKCRQV